MCVSEVHKHLQESFLQGFIVSFQRDSEKSLRGVIQKPLYLLASIFLLAG